MNVLFPEWRSEQETTKYPFADCASLDNGTRVIPKEAFVDGRLHPAHHAGGLYLSRVRIENITIELTVSDRESNAVATAVFYADDLPERVVFYDEYGRSAGLLIANRLLLSAIFNFGTGLHLFSPAQTAFVTRICEPAYALGIAGFKLPDEPGIVSGDVWFVSDRGIRFEESDEGIAIHAVGDPLFKRTLCAEDVETGLTFESYEEPRFIQEVVFRANNANISLKPDKYGDIRVSVNNALVTDTALRINPVSGGMSFKSATEASDDSK